MGCPKYIVLGIRSEESTNARTAGLYLTPLRDKITRMGASQCCYATVEVAKNPYLNIAYYMCLHLPRACYYVHVMCD